MKGRIHYFPKGGFAGGSRRFAGGDAATVCPLGRVESVRQSWFRAAIIWLTASAGLGAWVVLFSANCLNASVEAYGPIAQHLEHLHTLLWRYLAAGGVLFAAWTASGISFWRGRRADHGRGRANAKDSRRQVRAGTG